MTVRTIWPRTARSAWLTKPASSTVPCRSQSTHAAARRRPVSPSEDRPAHHGADLASDFSSSTRSYDRLGRRAKEKLLDREFFLSVLNSAATKREAKSYLARLKAQNTPPPDKRETSVTGEGAPASPVGGNVGAFYGASRSVSDAPVFRQDSTPTPTPEQQQQSERLHLALIKIKAPQRLDDATLDGVAKTLSQLNRLGMACCVVVDPGAADDSRTVRVTAAEQVDRLCNAVDAQPDSKAAHLDAILTLPSEAGGATPKVLSRKVLLGPLRDGQIVVIAPVAYTEDVPKAEVIPANDAVLALTRELAGLAARIDPDEDPLVTAERIARVQQEVSLDRVILLDPLGGIPSFSGPQTSHVFINLEQEFTDIENELLRVSLSLAAGDAHRPLPADGPLSTVADSNPFSRFAHTEVVGVPPEQEPIPAVSHPEEPAIGGHLDNLRLAHEALALLPATSSGIISSAAEVAHSAEPPRETPDMSAVRTRRQRNPLIHSLLTDKPLLSASLPVSRRAPRAHTTFVKRGLPLTIVPDPRLDPWSARAPSPVTLDDPRIDLPRLVHLIEDSFNRRLDVPAYLERVNHRLAGLIIAGEYEGGAILTWELPPGVPDDGSAASQARRVPYLDKFAVLKRSQGAGGVADMVFNAMVRTCFPAGVCWRSRQDNPVNKWYFERSTGTWKLSDTNWTMFWTTPGLVEDPQRFQDYEAVCRSIQPSWADDTGVVD
ncbi:mitochondrial amino-acid acetyltransferase [Aspergillus campestris IBT 28561]|uniref:Amino-acid acetyltransferase, mitochondrial n=1 Tax=Aspergillus campestris (strain IBT 28561) TaxID=1392248 RepID=A0A2I1D3S9_ASPC2|nr:mitochondrial amino-acid acetyltransferase [Aspergillus campestris IBT 28561]PKY04526.1 mitochondrial amino-acid acetyltransferase [Aspergillus campestris IBT 28561]